jgi:hypothetical protein
MSMKYVWSVLLADNNLVILQLQKGSTWYRSWLRHYATSRELPVRILDEVDFFNLSNPLRRTIALQSTQPLIKMTTRNLPWGKKRPACRADNLAAI